MNDHCGGKNSCGVNRTLQCITHHCSFIVFGLLCFGISAPPLALAQIETIEGPSPSASSWINQGQFEGHLATLYSPAGAFSPDSSLLAVVVEDKVVLMDLGGGAPQSLRPRVEGVSELIIHSVNFVTPGRLAILANGVIRPKGKGAPQNTPTLAFLWEVAANSLVGKVNAINASGDFTPPRYFPMIGYVGIAKEAKFELWHPLTSKGGRLTIPSLTRTPNLFELSPDGRWLVFAQLEGGGGADPVVADTGTGNLLDTLRGHLGTTLSIAFSRDNQRVVTACEDGKVRVFSTGNWALLHTLSGHNGTVKWAEFSPDGRRIVSGGFDRTVRIWSTEGGSLIQTLTEGKEPILTVAFSPNGEFVAASGAQIVWVWRSVRH